MADSSGIEHSPLHPLMVEMGLDAEPVPIQSLLNCIGVVRTLVEDSPHKDVPAVVYGFNLLDEYSLRIQRDKNLPAAIRYVRDQMDEQLKTNLSRVVPIAER